MAFQLQAWVPSSLSHAKIKKQFSLLKNLAVRLLCWLLLGHDFGASFHIESIDNFTDLEHRPQGIMALLYKGVGIRG